jgi:2-dehydro-3-deoxygluconokinase
MRTVVTFGEIMLRLSTPGAERMRIARNFEVIYGGGEANVAASLANFGAPVEYVTRLPTNDLGEGCLSYLHQFNVGTRYTLRGGERLGIYFLETGYAQRPSKVVYDRTNSSFATIGLEMVDWAGAFATAGWFHWTGITPAVSAGAADACLEGIQAARERGLTISCDLNYRAKLWKWTKAPGEVMERLVALSDIAIGNEEDAEKVFGIKAPSSDVIAGKLDAQRYQLVCEALSGRFPNLKAVAITLRGSLSASHNTWSAVLWTDGNFLVGPQYDLLPIVDRVGGGDAFSAGLIYGWNAFAPDHEQALRFAVAASCLKHSIPGDFNQVSVAEVETLMAGDASGRIAR